MEMPSKAWRWLNEHDNVDTKMRFEAADDRVQDCVDYRPETPESEQESETLRGQLQQQEMHRRSLTRELESLKLRHTQWARSQEWKQKDCKLVVDHKKDIKSILIDSKQENTQHDSLDEDANDLYDRKDDISVLASEPQHPPLRVLMDLFAQS